MSKHHDSTRRSRRRAISQTRPISRRKQRPNLELSEAKLLLSSTYQVTTTADNGNNAAPTLHSLRWAIVQADATRLRVARQIRWAGV